MKATNNTDTLFMDIFVELFAIAKVYFEELFKNADPGTYTIKDIYAFIEKNIEATKEGKLTGVSSYFSDRYKKTLKKSPYYTKVNSFEKYTISYSCRVTDNIVSIEKENFKCSFDIIKVFEYLERFKKLSGAKDKLEFTKETEIKEGQKSTSFEIELNKDVIKSLTSVKTEKKDIMNRYTENTVHLSLTDSTIYATNCFVSKAKRVDAKNVLGEIKDILIPFGVLKNIGAGNCNFTVTEGEKTYNIVVKNTTTDKVVSYSFEKIEKFIDYKFVYPELYKEMNICLKDTKLFVNRIKTQQKACNRLGLSYFLIQVIKGLKEIKVVTCNEAYLSLIEPSLSKTYKNHLDAIYKETPKEGDYVEFNLSCNADAPIYTGLILNDPGLGLVCIVDGQKIEVREMINLKVLKQEESKTVSPTQSGEESALNDKERSKAKETKPTMQYTDDMLELVSLDLNSMTYVVNGDIGTAKNIQSIVLYDEIGKIVVSCDDGKKIECQFDGESILQSVLKEM